MPQSPGTEHALRQAEAPAETAARGRAGAPNAKQRQTRAFLGHDEIPRMGLGRA